MDKSLEEQRLQEADLRIEQERRRITEHEALLASGRLHGKDLEDALALLATMQASLQASQDHRSSIAKTIQDIESGRL